MKRYSGEYYSDYIMRDSGLKSKPNPYIKRIRMGEEYYLVEVRGNSAISLRKVVAMNFPNSETMLVRLKFMNIANKANLAIGEVTPFICDTSNIPCTGQTIHIIRLSQSQALCKDKKAVSEFLKFLIGKQLIINKVEIPMGKGNGWMNDVFSAYRETMKELKTL